MKSEILFSLYAFFDLAYTISKGKQNRTIHWDKKCYFLNVNLTQFSAMVRASGTGLHIEVIFRG